jgi:hypothetical protein
VLFRFLTRLRAHLLDPQAEPFRLRNPRTTATLTSPFAPAIGASLAGLALGIYPSKQMRVSIAIYALFRALEFGWNVCEKDGLIWGVRNGKNRERPWWFGSWMLQPFAFGQLFHAAVFDPDCFPSVRFVTFPLPFFLMVMGVLLTSSIVVWGSHLQKLVHLPASAARKLSHKSQVAFAISDPGKYRRDGSTQLAVSLNR